MIWMMYSMILIVIIDKNVLIAFDDMIADIKYNKDFIFRKIFVWRRY